MSSTYYVISNRINWADELNISGIFLYTGAELKQAKNNINSIKKSYPKIENKTYTVYIGTNEDIDVSISDVEDFLSSATKITEGEYKTLCKYVGDIGINLYDSFISRIDDDIEELEEAKEAEEKRKLELKKYKASPLGKNEFVVSKLIEKISEDIK